MASFDGDYRVFLGFVGVFLGASVIGEDNGEDFGVDFFLTS